MAFGPVRTSMLNEQYLMRVYLTVKIFLSLYHIRELHNAEGYRYSSHTHIWQEEAVHIEPCHAKTGLKTLNCNNSH